MDICAIICELNPLHNGHAYLIESARRLTGCDAVLLIMSGSFTQRGEMCILDKYVRARHAILSGADAVIELPAPFAVAPAEIFARGAVKILSSIPDVKSLCFGCEEVADFGAVAKYLSDEDGAFRERLSSLLENGEGYAFAYSKAAEKYSALLSSPNNILAVEYAKANLKEGSRLALFPVKRQGNGYHSEKLSGKFASARAIRGNLHCLDTARFVPDFVFGDLKQAEDRTERFKQLAADCLFFADKQKLKGIYGCSEGLENRLKNLSTGFSFDEIIEKCTNKRYSSTRIRRIICANMLSSDRKRADEALTKRLPVKVLAVRKPLAASILPLLSSDGDDDECVKRLTAITDDSYRIWRYINYPHGEDNVNQKMILV